MQTDATTNSALQTHVDAQDATISVMQTRAEEHATTISALQTQLQEVLQVFNSFMFTYFILKDLYFN